MNKLKEMFTGLLNQTVIPNKTDENALTEGEPGLVAKFSDNRLYYSVPGPLRIHAEGDIELVSDKHIMLNSGQQPEQERSGYVYGVWFNTSRDQYGRPVQDIAPGKFNSWVPYKHRYRTQILKNKLHNRRHMGGCGCGCK